MVECMIWGKGQTKRNGKTKTVVSKDVHTLWHFSSDVGDVVWPTQYVTDKYSQKFEACNLLNPATT